MSRNINKTLKWGPFSKKYAGVSNIATHKKYTGIRFDLCVAPAISAFDIRVPNVTLPSAYHPWLCNEDYSFYSFRYDLQWKDKVFSDVSYTKLSDNSILIRTETVNNTDIIKNCVINYFSSIEYPQTYYTEACLPEDVCYKDALDYESYSYAEARPWDRQSQDGRKKGEFLDCRFVGGRGLGDRSEKWHMPHKVIEPFGATMGDKVSYKLKIDKDIEDAVIAVRYRTSDIFYRQGLQVGVNYICSEKTSVFDVNGITAEFKACDEPEIAYIFPGKIKKGIFDLCFEAKGTGAVEFDFIAVTEKTNKDKIKTEKKPVSFLPGINNGKAPKGFISTLKYEDIEGSYKLRIFDDNTRFREIHTGALEDCMTARLSNADETFDDVTESFTGAFSRKHSDDGFFHNAISHTIFIKPGERNVSYAVISKGDTDYLTEAEYEKIYLQAKATAIDFKLNASGKKYKLSNQILAATLMTNVVYPIYKHGENIIHHTPGKRWDCLYTWDSGFIGLGMNEIAPKLAEYIIDTYLSCEDNPDYAFLHHGSPVPVQIYQLYEMLQKTNDKSTLLSFYPRARLYYLFLAGKIRGSTTAKFRSGLLTTYDYFYSSSGMDDYPAQVAMMKNNLRDKASPVITTAQVIRFGKILSILADRLGFYEDARQYGEDISSLTAALNRYSWDKDSGYYGYVLHDENYEPTEIYRNSQGENLNKGLDGIYPIIAGVCDDSQKIAIISHLTNEREMHSPFGISAVDMSASYYKVNGYWNGNIWFPHQWFIFKSMLDLGENEIARDIAHMALDIWKREVDDSYYTFEMVNTVTGCGGWFHNFGGLSTPLIMWLKAYYSPGTVNTGFDTYLEAVHIEKDLSSAEIKAVYYGNSRRFTVICVMSEEKSYDVFVDGEGCDFRNINGAIEISLSVGYKSEFKIEIKEK